MKYNILLPLCVEFIRSVMMRIMTCSDRFEGESKPTPSLFSIYTKGYAASFLKDI
jgi:hypothetical protein